MEDKIKEYVDTDEVPTFDNNSGGGGGSSVHAAEDKWFKWVIVAIVAIVAAIVLIGIFV